MIKRFIAACLCSLLCSALGSHSGDAAEEKNTGKSIAVLMPYAETDGEALLDVKMLVTSLQALGWAEGKNVQIARYWTGGDPKRMSEVAKSVVDAHPDVVLARGTPAVRAIRAQSPEIAIVFVSVADPVGDGFVQNFPHPGGNTTGFTNYDPLLGGKWVQILKEIDPDLKEVVPMFNPETAPGKGLVYLASMEDAAKKYSMSSTPLVVHDVSDIEKGVAELNGKHEGIIITPDVYLMGKRESIVSAANRYHVPALYTARQFVNSGGLVSHGIDIRDLYRRAAPYIDRILKGERAGDLPIQTPTKFEFVINLKAAHTYGFQIPQSLLGLADDVIE